VTSLKGRLATVGGARTEPHFTLDPQLLTLWAC